MVFFGAYPSIAAARERVDALLKPAPRVVRVGPNTWQGGPYPSVEWRGTGGNRPTREG